MRRKKFNLESGLLAVMILVCMGFVVALLFVFGKLLLLGFKGEYGIFFVVGATAFLCAFLYGGIKGFD